MEMDEMRKKRLQARIEKLKIYSSEDVAVEAARLLNKTEKNSSYAVFSVSKETELQFVVAEISDWEILTRQGYQMRSHKLYD